MFAYFNRFRTRSGCLSALIILTIQIATIRPAHAAADFAIDAPSHAPPRLSYNRI